ncbi:MAG: SLC13 family permease [Gemmatimonadaceae bacterium]|nr:SLC13 family permease [Gemmatimonadaceae bacterium]
MTPDIILTLAITLAALALFTWNRVPVEVVALLVLAALIVTGLVTPQEGFSGFANEATVTVALLLVLSTGLLHTGAVDALGRLIGRLAGRSEMRLLLVIVAFVVPVSAVMNNTAAIAVLLPVVLGLSRTAKVAPSRLLMPLSFAGQLGGTLTLIGTSTNLLVAGIALDAGLGRIGLFDFTAPALVLAAIGVAYLLTFGRWLTPTREPPAGLLESYEMREYLTALQVASDAPLAGRTLAESRFGDRYGLQIVEVRRAGGLRVALPTGATVVQADDVLVVTGNVPDIARIGEAEHLTIVGVPPRFAADADKRGGSDPLPLAELLVPMGSYSVGRTVTELDLRRRYGLNVLALQRHGSAVHESVGRVRLQSGDLLLARGEPDALRALHDDGTLALLGPVQLPARRQRKMVYAAAIMAGVVLLPALGVTPIVVSALLGVLAMVLTGCLTPTEAYDGMDWSVLVLLGAILPLGGAIRDSGTAAWIATMLLDVVAPLGPHGTLAAVYVLTVALTSVISNAAAALVVVPVAVATAAGLEISPMPLVIAVMFAASCSFITPIGYQTNTFIYGPGGYRFSDFVRVGAPLNLVMAVATTIVVPWFFPF